MVRERREGHGDSGLMDVKGIKCFLTLIKAYTLIYFMAGRS